VIGSHKGAGNSATITSYRFIDEQIADQHQPVLYYRLKQVDFDGSATVYNTVAIAIAGTTAEFQVSTFPNPVTTAVQLQVSNVQAGPMHIAIYDIRGNLVVQQDQLLETGSSSVTVSNLDGLTDGVYFIYATLNGNVYRQKLVKAAH
jgi:hypothetical protein